MYYSKQNYSNYITSSLRLITFCQLFVSAPRPLSLEWAKFSRIFKNVSLHIFAESRYLFPPIYSRSRTLVP